MEYRLLGFYICEAVPAGFLQRISPRFLSVSGCIGELHPDWRVFWTNGGEAFRQQYRERINLNGEKNDEKFARLLSDFGEFIGRKKIDADSRFTALADAEYFRREYFSQIDCKTVGVSTDSESYRLLESALGCPLCGEPDCGELLGCDILGWDISGFHSFLCNSLHKELPEAKFTELGLLSNPFEETADFARRIEGLGEPVDWLPARISEYR